MEGAERGEPHDRVGDDGIESERPPRNRDPMGSSHRPHERGWVKRWWRRLRPIVIWQVFVHLIYPQLLGVRKAIHVLQRVSPVVLVIGVGLQAAALIAYARLTKACLPAGQRPHTARLLRIQLATKAVTNLVPGGTVAGQAIGFRFLTDAGPPGPVAGFAMATAGIGSAVVLNVLLWIAVVWTLPTRGVNPLYATAAVVGLVLLALFGAVLLALTAGRERAERVVRAVGRRIRFIGEERAARIVSTLAARVAALTADRDLLWRAAGWATANWLLDAACLWVFLRAFGVHAPVDGLLVAFCLANVLAAIPLTPGGLGVVEATLTTTLVGFGLDRATAGVGVLSYRLAQFWLPIPVGLISYLSLRGERRALAAEAMDEAERLRPKPPRPSLLRPKP